MVKDVVNAVRIRMGTRDGRFFYVVISDKEIICSTPANADPEGDFLATLTALTRTMSVALQHNVSWSTIKKQLRESSIVKGDIPDVILRAVKKWEKTTDK